LPKGNDKLAFLGSTRVLEPLIRRAVNPKGIDDLVYSDLPPLFVDQINFADATLMFVTLPYYLTDGMGFSTFLEAWIAVLHGHEDKVPECHSFVDDLRSAMQGYRYFEFIKKE
jgi:hypothetical protein